MMRTLAAITFLLITPELFAAPVPKELRRDRIVGTWKVVTVHSDGKLANAASNYWTIDPNGDLNTHNNPDAPASPSPEVRLNFDLARRGVEYFENASRKGSPGIYELKGDELTIAFNIASDTRPRSFEAGQGINLWKFTRVDSEGKK